MLLFIIDEKGIRRELTRADLERLPHQQVYRSTSLRGLSIGGVAVSVLLDRLFPSRAAHYLAAESTDGERLALSAEEMAGAVLVYRLGIGPLTTQMGGPLRLMLENGGRIVSVQRLRGIHLSVEPFADLRAARDAA